MCFAGGLNGALFRRHSGKPPDRIAAPQTGRRMKVDDEGLQRNEESYRLLVDSVRDYAIFMLDPEGRVLTWNTGAERIKGYREDEIVGSHFSRFYPPEALARRLPEHELEMAERDGAFEDEGWRVRKDGSLFWANVIISAMRGDSGRLVGFAKVMRDLTQRRNHEEALRRSEERFRLLVEGVADYAIFMLDVNGRVATWNEGAQRIKGYAADEILGQHFSAFYPAEVRDSGWPEYELQQARETGRFMDAGWRLRKDGSRFWAQVTLTALRDESGQLVGFAKLTRDMTDSMRIEAMELASREHEEILDAERNARIAAQRATRMKDEFLATLSHELRTPLTSILGWTQVLLRAKPGDERINLQRAIEVIDRNARAQVQLIDDLLDLNRIMNGKLRLDLQQVDIAGIIQAAVESVAPSASAKGVELQSLLDAGHAMVNGDSGRLQQVVWNLLNNAIKFTPAGGRVQVLLQRVDSRVAFSVSDTGIGIPANFLPQVFDRFTQQDGSTSRAHGGLGLGLAICRQLIELHGGSIRAESAGEGQGASFFVSLPLSSQQTADERADDSTANDTRASENLALPKLDGVHIFVLDDEPDARGLLCRILEDQGARVVAFASAQELLKALQLSRPTVIVSDVGMPGVDGYQMIRALRATETRDSRIPALALTAFARAEDRKRSLMAGFQAHLAKPFDVAELILLVANLAEK
jgi:PAS domain S-box-containing protein